MVKAPACTFVIFGISGDLAARKLLPALFELHREGAIDPKTRIVGFARRDWSDDELRERMKDALQEYSHGDFDQDLWDDLAPRLSFCGGNYDDPESYHSLAEHLDTIGHDIRLFYTATPPSTYANIADSLGQAGLSRRGDTRFIIEKPFGTDLASAQALNGCILESFSENQVYRIDHYLAKETAQNIAALRFANTLFEPTWNGQYVDHVQVTMAEPIGIEGRGGFYEQTGIIRDVIQNHLLQLAALVATEPPASYDAQSVRDEKVKVLRAMHCVNVGDAVMGQYVSSNGQSSYRDEKGVDSRSRQATYAAIELNIDNWRWSGVPFYIRSGKRLVAKSTEIVLYYKTPPHIPFQFRKPPRADRIVLRLVPNEGISLRYNAKVPGQGITLNTATMDFFYNEQFKRRNPDAYETLLLDAMMGDATLFMRADEVEEQWRIVTPLLNTWENANEEPAFYESGSWGPEEAEEMLAQAGRRWHIPQIDD